MEMTVSQPLDSIPVTLLGVEGTLDGSNYAGLIVKATELQEQGSQGLLLDLSKLRYMSSAGISALHRVALIFQGKKSEELHEGWAEFHKMRHDLSNGKQKHVKLLNPTAQVIKVLDMTGFGADFETFTDTHAALASFQ